MPAQEPILHLAKRGVKQPESLRASEIKRLSEWVILAFQQHQREASRFGSTATLIKNTNNLLEPIPGEHDRSNHAEDFL